MKHHSRLLLLPLISLGVSAAMAAEDPKSGYYGAINAIETRQQAHNMDLSERPGIGSFVAGNEKQNFLNGSLAAGYQYGNGWRTEGEYVFKKSNEYTSGSSTFATSFNHMTTDSQRLMLNVYRDFMLTDKFAVYATAGVGIAKIDVGGWQGNDTRHFADSTQTNFTYSLGAGVSYEVLENLTAYAGYRYVDMGNVESGRNTFVNARGLQDENLRARLTNNEYLIGIRYTL
ncbi:MULTISPECIES: outer membrane protein [Serratia]|uniref:outer membrane protein n=1 Tax=Serratia TaxID=613 RepID=UPI0007456358|nr:outer membrane beta-barrel protein [Serratia marcescens]EME1463571.1 porin family protein [Serratia marcescens]MBH3209531.1 porin family protein [Serratia marcescens]MBN3900268.1 porin family protein [Serratia marcescens]MBN3912878.1 porin family protein [Serratia marcescens]MBN3918229.1 porin family protein [Serratia marcescens]